MPRKDVYPMGGQQGDAIILHARLSAAADGTINHKFYNKNCPSGVRVLSAYFFQRSLRTGGTPDHDITLRKGDGAASESFSTIGTADFDGATTDTQTFLTIDDANFDIAANGSLDLNLVVGGTTTGGTALIDVVVVVTPLS